MHLLLPSTFCYITLWALFGSTLRSATIVWGFSPPVPRWRWQERRLSRCRQQRRRWLERKGSSGPLSARLPNDLLQPPRRPSHPQAHVKDSATPRGEDSGEGNGAGGVRQLSVAASAAAATCALSCALLGLAAAPPPSLAGTGFDGISLGPCRPDTNCVSSGYSEPPNRYVSPLRLVRDRDGAFRRAVRDLSEEGTVAEIVPGKFYVHLTVPGTAPGSIDDVELLFADTIVNLRCEARVTLPTPPFCLKRGCINGNMDQRTRLERVARTLGLPPSDQEQMQKAKWTPIFFNSDRVPDMDDYDDSY